MPRVSAETIKKLNVFIGNLTGDTKSKCDLCSQTLTHIVKTAEAQTGAPTATVTRALAESINETALPGDQVSGEKLRDRVRYQEGKVKMGNSQNNTEPSMDDVPLMAIGEQEIMSVAKQIKAENSKKTETKQGGDREDEKIFLRKYNAFLKEVQTAKLSGWQTVPYQVVCDCIGDLNNQICHYQGGF